jgi:hypothetical protein
VTKKARVKERRVEKFILILMKTDDGCSLYKYCVEVNSHHPSQVVVDWWRRGSGMGKQCGYGGIRHRSQRVTFST